MTDDSQGPRWLKVSTAIAALVVAILCSAHLDQMFLDGHLGYAGSLRGVIGRNYLRYDPLDIRLAPLQNGGPTQDAEPSVRFNHPPLSGMLVGLAFSVSGGPSEAAARIVPILFSVLTVPLLAGFVRRLWGDTTAVIAVLLWCLSPFVAIYGAMVSYEPLVICFWALTLWGWSQWRLDETPRASLIVVAVGAILGIWTDWPMVALLCGLLALELVETFRRRPRRPAMLLTLVASLLGGLGLLAVYYLLILDIDGDGLESLYRARSSLGRWNAWDVLVHISQRTVALLTWPLAIAAAAGFILAIRRRSAPLMLLLGLVGPGLGLLFLLPQHAVIHCFSAWYLLPGVAISAALLLYTIGHRLQRRGPLFTALLIAVFAGLYLWQSAPVITEGWISDGSPFEGRPRLEYRHLVLARWVGEHTEANDRLLIDPATGVIGVRAWFQHGRALRRLRRGEDVLRAIERSQTAIALIAAQTIDPATFLALCRRWKTTVIDDDLVIDSRASGPNIEVLESVETPMSWWWTYAHSASYPPHRYRRAAAREALLWRRLGEEAARVELEEANISDVSLAELASRHGLSSDPNEARSLAQRMRRRLDQRLDTELCPNLRVEGIQLESSPHGPVSIRLLFQTLTPLEELPRIEAMLLASQGRSRPVHRWHVNADDLLSWPSQSFVTSSRRFSSTSPISRFRLRLQACGRRVESSPFEMSIQPPLPGLAPIGRL